jgi:VIT1/CCC1 family predicted Fe2+/Mn2+ transporter
MLGGIISTLSGALSMGLGDYLAIDSVKDRKDVAYLSALRVFFGYAIASTIPLLPYLMISNVKLAFKLSLLLSFITLVIFGYVRAQLLKDVIPISIGKTVAIGAITFGLTYQVSKIIPV